MKAETDESDRHCTFHCTAPRARSPDFDVRHLCGEASYRWSEVFWPPSLSLLCVCNPQTTPSAVSLSAGDCCSLGSRSHCRRAWLGAWLLFLTAFTFTTAGGSAAAFLSVTRDIVWLFLHRQSVFSVRTACLRCVVATASGARVSTRRKWFSLSHITGSWIAACKRCV
jgi:hypothetical protein